MIPGYNHNISYQGRIYHVQTEDSGIDNPHIITHLFVGGNIIETRKTSYADIAKSERLTEMLVELMQDQHKTMLKDLISGRLDHRISERSQNAATLNGPAPLNVEAGAQHRSSLLMPAVESAPPPTHAAHMPAPTRSPSPPVVPPPAPPVLQKPVPVPVPAPVPARPAATPAPARPAAAAPVARPAVTATPAAARPAARVGPPPTAHHAPPPAAPRAAATAKGPTPPPLPRPEEVIAAETLQRAFDSKDASAVDSIFGEDLISEKSLDEVILSYLAEDMQRE